MSNGDPRGQFVWHELLTGDAGAAAAFYGRVVPWKTQAWEADPSYSMWVAQNGPVGGIASLGEASTPRWLAYIGVSDVEATLESAESLGARIVKGATEIPNGGVYALLADPQGAEFGIYKSSQPANGEANPAADAFTWHELATTDVTAAMEFYTKLFGWEVGPVHDMGGALGTYHLFLRGGKKYGGIYKSTDASGGPNWLCYIGVEDAGKAANAVKSAGGRVIEGPTEVPDGSWVVMAMDAEGVMFAVNEPAKAAAASAEPPAAEPEERAPPESPPSQSKPPESKPKSSITKPPKAARGGGAASSITKPPRASGGGAASSITKPPQAVGGGAASSITKPPRASGGGAASSITKPPLASGGGAASSITKPPRAARGGAASSVTQPPKKAAKKKKKPSAKPAKSAAARSTGRSAAGKVAKKAKKKAPARKTGGKAAKGKAAAKKAAGKKKSAAKRAPAKKKTSRAKAKKHR
jgi:predicted enzyme related to lactoylglutathione lyase